MIVTSKMIAILKNIVFFNDDIDLDYTNCDIIALFHDIDINTVDVINIILGDNYNDDSIEIMIHVRLAALCNEYKQFKAIKKEISKELMLVVWHFLLMKSSTNLSQFLNGDNIEWVLHKI